MDFVIDIEANDLLANAIDYSSMPFKLKDTFKVHCVVIRHIDSGRVKSLYGEALTKAELRKTLAKCTNLIGHNIVNYDLPILKLAGLIDYSINYPDTEYGAIVFDKAINLSDTLIWSKLLNADRYGGHSLEAWGKRLGNAKSDFSDWSEFSQTMLDYCIQDTSVNADIYKALLEEAGDIQRWIKPYRMETKLVDLTLKQELFGFDFNKELALKSSEELGFMMKDIALKVDPLLPKKKMPKVQYSEYIMPKVRFKKDGTISANFNKFLTKIGAKLDADCEYVLFNGKEYSVE